MADIAVYHQQGVVGRRDPRWFPAGFDLVAHVATTEPQVAVDATQGAPGIWTSRSAVVGVYADPFGRSTSVGDVLLLPNGSLLQVTPVGFVTVDRHED